jgi:hypothetical protein
MQHLGDEVRTACRLSEEARMMDGAEEVGLVLYG